MASHVGGHGAGGAGGSATRGRYPTPRPCGDPADTDEAGISLGPTRKPMTFVPSADRGKRPAPMTRLTAPAEPDVADHSAADGCRRRVHAGRCGGRQRLPGAPAPPGGDPGVRPRTASRPRPPGNRSPPRLNRRIRLSTSANPSPDCCLAAEPEHFRAILLRNSNTIATAWCIDVTSVQARIHR
jgi:hypothetical protein